MHRHGQPLCRSHYRPEVRTAGDRFVPQCLLPHLQPREKRKYRALWQLEKQTLDRLRAHYSEESITPTVGWGTTLTGTLLGALIPLMPWRAMNASALKETGPLLVVFRRLAETADEQHKPLFNYVIAHELAIEDFARRELAGQGNDSLKAVEALLRTDTA